MKKTLMKIVAILATTTMAVGATTSFSSNAVYSETDGFDNPPDGYILVEDAMDWFPVASEYSHYDFQIYQKIDEDGIWQPSLYQVIHHLYNSQHYDLTSDNYDAFEAIWEKYEPEMQYDTYEVYNYTPDSDTIRVSIVDYSSSSNAKKDVVQAFVTELKGEDLVVSATYSECDCYTDSYGGYDTGILILNLDDTVSAEDILSIVSEYDADATVIESDEVVGKIGYDNTGGYYVTPLVDISHIHEITVALENAYPEADCSYSVYFQEDAVNIDETVIDLFSIEDWSEFVATATEDDIEPIPDDVTVEEPTIDTLCGDIDADGSITPFDARLALVAYASEQVGQDTGLTDDQMALADVDGDGVVTAVDAHYILVYYATEQVSTFVTWDAILNAE